MDYISVIKEYVEINGSNRNWLSKLTKILNTDNAYLIFKDTEFPFLNEPTDIQIIWHVLNDDREIHICENCSKTVKFNRQVHYRKFCSKNCTALHTAANLTDEQKYNMVKKREETCIKKYGTKYAMQTDKCKEKKKQTSLKKYGTEHAMQNKEVHDKQFKSMQETNILKYGTKSTLGLEKTREKMKTTMLERYGVDHPSKSDEILNKVRQTMLDRYGMHYTQTPEWFERFKNHEWGNKYKDYITPNKNILRIQGYENFALDKLFESQDENNVVVNKITSIIGKIQYTFNTKLRLYKPDIYIKSEHKIIEVKSQFTYDVQLEKNKLKAQACLKLGFKFEFWIINRKGKIEIMQVNVS